MKRWLWYIGIIAAVAVLSGRATPGQDIGKLQPVQTVWVTGSNGMVIVQTDTGDWGAGEDLTSALEDMKEVSTGEIFLETADYLIVSPNCRHLLPVMMEYLRPSCAVCLADGQPALEQAGQFLQLHEPEITLMQCRAGEKKLPTLVTEDGRMRLVS